MSSRPMKVALIHHIAGGNLGEDASVAAVRENIRTRWPHSEIVCLPMLRDDFAGELSWPLSHRVLNGRTAAISNQQAAKQKLKSLLIRQRRLLKSLQMLYRIARKPVAAVQELIFLRRAFHALRSFDVLVLSGGDQLGEITGQHRNFRPSWKYASHVLRWVLLAKIARAGSVLVNVGSAPQHGLARKFVTGALWFADSVGFRDERCRKSFSLSALNGKSFVLSEPAYSRRVVAPRAPEQSYHAMPVVGIAPMLMADPKAPLDSAFLHRMSAFVVWLTNNGYFVRLFCSNINVDSAGVCHMQEILKRDALGSVALANMDRVHQWSAEELLTNMSSLDYVVTSRFHGVVFAHLLNKPLLAISDHQCVRNLMDTLGLSPYCLSMVDTGSDGLRNAFLSMVDRGTAIKEGMAAQLASIQEELTEQFDGLFPSHRQSFDAVEPSREAFVPGCDNSDKSTRESSMRKDGRPSCIGSAPATVAILHYTGGGNLGDQASVDAVIGSVRKRWPHSVLALLSMNPTETARIHGIDSYPLRTHQWSVGYSAQVEANRSNRFPFLGWLRRTRSPVVRLPRVLLRELVFWVSALRIMRRFDLLIVSGGGQLTGKSGPWGFPFGILSWFLAARLNGAQRMFLNVGAGPLTEPLTKFFVLRALNAANYVSFRDEPSQALARRIGFQGESCVFPDNVYSLDLSLSSVSSVSRNGKPVVGIAPLAYPSRSFQIAEHKAAYDALIQKFAAFTSSLVQRGYAVELFGTDIGEDPATVEDLRSVLRDHHDIRTRPYSPTTRVDELLRDMSRMDYVVTCRFHAVVFAHLLNKPMLAISPHPKVSDHMAALGFYQYCVDIGTFDPCRLTERFEELVRDRHYIEDRLADRLVQYRSLLQKQLDSLFPPRRDVVEDVSLSRAFSLGNARHKNGANI